MKTKRIAVCMMLAGGLGLGAFRASALHEVSASVEIRAEADFHVPLARHGVWIEVGSYGRCWRPAAVEVHWRPYCHGYWVWTDCGWYWVSDEPWAWACYHYGRWVYDSHHGWVWAPDVVWGPAWVTWRVGGGFVGWAPLPPRVSFRSGVILASHVKVAPDHFVFVEGSRFHERVTPKTVIVKNKTVIEKTTLVTNIKQVERTTGGSASKRVVVNEGPGLETIEKTTGRKARTVALEEAARQTPAPDVVKRKENRQGTPRVGPAPEKQERAKPGEPGKIKPSPNQPDKRVVPSPDKPPRKEGAPSGGKKGVKDREKGKGRPKKD